MYSHLLLHNWRTNFHVLVMYYWDFTVCSGHQYFHRIPISSCWNILTAWEVGRQIFLSASSKLLECCIDVLPSLRGPVYTKCVNDWTWLFAVLDLFSFLYVSFFAVTRMNWYRDRRSGVCWISSHLWIYNSQFFVLHYDINKCTLLVFD